jgi:hypothetical protein
VDRGPKLWTARYIWMHNPLFSLEKTHIPKDEKTDTSSSFLHPLCQGNTSQTDLPTQTTGSFRTICHTIMPATEQSLCTTIFISF